MAETSRGPLVRQGCRPTCSGAALASSTRIRRIDTNPAEWITTASVIEDLGVFQPRQHQGQVRQAPSSILPQKQRGPPARAFTLHNARGGPQDNLRQGVFDMANMVAEFQALGRQHAASENRASPPVTEDGPDKFFDAADVNGDDAQLLYPISPLVNSVPYPIQDSGASSHLFPSSVSFMRKKLVCFPIHIANGKNMREI